MCAERGVLTPCGVNLVALVCSHATSSCIGARVGRQSHEERTAGAPEPPRPQVKATESVHNIERLLPPPAQPL